MIRSSINASKVMEVVRESFATLGMTVTWGALCVVKRCSGPTAVICWPKRHNTISTHGLRKIKSPLFTNSLKAFLQSRNDCTSRAD
jgi:hypothetical protein